MRWTCRDHLLTLGDKTCVMGILNCTPDSFSDGGRYLDVDAAVQHGLRMVEEGAVILDVGGESTRPGAATVPVAEELRRVEPVVSALRRHTDVLISVDTRKAEVADAACRAGADIVNDVSACTDDPGMVDVVRRYGVGVILMHMRGQPATMQQDPAYDNVVRQVSDYLVDRITALTAAGVVSDAIVVDPGIGFGKTVQHNLALIDGIAKLRDAGRPVLMGVSRKSFLEALTGREVGDRGAASMAAHAVCVLQGADILRVHDVKDTCDVVAVVDMLKQRWNILST